LDGCEALIELRLGKVELRRESIVLAREHLEITRAAALEYL
jgi:hypothetical protein